MPKVIPDATMFAAKRGFVRTFSQSLATSLVIPAGLTLAFTHDALLTVAVGAASMLAGAAVNGAQSYFDIISKGVPDEYQVDEPERRGKYAAD